MTAPNDVTGLLLDWASGDKSAFDRLLPLVYTDLERIARRQLIRERDDHTLNTQALVHESYLNLLRGAQANPGDRGHFFAVASKAMRHILIDHARKKKAQKRGGDRVAVTLDEASGASEAGIDRLLEVNRALEDLETMDERLARVVECRFFAGLSVQETAEALDSSVRTVERDWTRAKAYLKRALEP